MFYGCQELKNFEYDILSTGSRRVGVWRWVDRPIAEFFCENFFYELTYRRTTWH